MAFCINCGQQLNEGAKFCANCGAKITITPPPIPVVQPPQPTKRETVYEGNIHKCPHCGESLKSFTAICPACKQEIRETKTTSAIALFEEKLEQATTEQQRIVIVQNFGIPNTIEDITEFMILASSNFDAEYYASHLDEADIHDAWWTKIQQCYQKAKISFQNEDFERIENLYSKIKKNIEKITSNKKKRTLVSIILITGGLLLVLTKFLPVATIGLILLSYGIARLIKDGKRKKQSKEKK